MRTDAIDALFAELDPVRTVPTEREQSQQVRIEELISRLERAEARIKTSDTVKLKKLRADLATIAEKGKQANRGQLVKWVRKAREESA